MSKKKRFGLSEALSRGLTETINVVENNAGIFRNIILPLSRIELDPDNPRKLHINLLDVKSGIRSDDPHFSEKNVELEKLKELAHTVKSSGVINPIVVYKRGELYRIVAGERRCLASILAGKQEIEARVFNDKPKGFDLKLIQWIENTAREDLTLDERLGNVREMMREYQLQEGPVDFSATLLKQLTGLSLSQTTYYLAAMNAPEDVQFHIQQGNIKSLDKAALIANVAAIDLRKRAIDACIAGSSLKELRNLISHPTLLKKVNKELNTDPRGRSPIKINMGTTVQPEVVKTIIECVVKHADFAKYEEVFSKVDWFDLRQSASAFRKLIEILEVEATI